MRYVWILNPSVRDNTPDPNGGTVVGGLGVLLGTGMLLVALISAGLVGLHLVGVLTGELETQIPRFAAAAAIGCIIAMVVTSLVAYGAARSASADGPLGPVQHCAMVAVAAILGYATVAMATYGALAVNFVLTDRHSPLLANILVCAALSVVAVGIASAWPKGRVVVGSILAATLGCAAALGLSGTKIAVF